MIKYNKLKTKRLKVKYFYNCVVLKDGSMERLISIVPKLKSIMEREYRSHPLLQTLNAIDLFIDDSTKIFIEILMEDSLLDFDNTNSTTLTNLD